MSKVAVATGAASGIGEAVAQRLAEDDYVVVIVDINEEGGKRVAADIQQRGRQAAFMHLDVTREAEVHETFKKIISDHGRIDVLVNVAGGSLHRHKIEVFPLNHWQAVIDLNLTSTFLCCRAVAGLMKSQKSGAIINISSDIGFSGDPNRSAYAAAKAGIVGLSKTLALELAPFGARANVVAPGRIATPRVRATYSDADWAAAAQRIPLGHAGEPEDIAEAVAFLASDLSRHMTGQTLHINGGRIMP
ncbi:MAG TPA: SDR family NAD(P)-dependent oxidoreductase [Candidatus Binatia bacterium]|nr:SDR family NAD(P)-dependent oxidoreductase [Candidatus Binatia bacterium]